ncbi:hypothetical protein PRZ48_007902 [Zasmidium cellare]|uniref:AB hydrolase-1 domain-containing protein n=1 Tax=Zasmidium cellare TaxID=395010 RepID=A0ABR0ELE1_ZASCE|nr:hypothetical protein PRZ48_007902 [Zasmidium cellare]
MPGFGESFNPKDDPPSIEWYSSMYHDVFSNVPEFQHGCHIIGHHSGAVIGTDFAARYPGVVESLTLVGPAVLTPEERKKMAQKTMEPFNTPVDDGSHLKRTWDYLIEIGIPANNRDLLHREVLDHARAWRGRMQIYACRIEVECKMLAMCALDDVLWPMFKNVESVGRGIRCEEINGANFEPDLAPDEIVKHFLALIGATDVL